MTTPRASARWRRMLLVGGVLGVGATAAFAPGWAVIGSLSIVTIVWVLLLPRLAVPFLVVGLSLQDVLVLNLQRVSPSLADALQSLDEIALVAAGVRVGLLLAAGDRRWFRMKDWWWVVVFLLAGGASSLLHWSGAARAGLGLALSCKFFGFLLLALSIPWEPADGPRLVRATALAGFVLLAAGLLGWLFPDFTASHFAGLEGDVEFTRGGFIPFMVPFVSPGLYGWALAVTGLAAFSLLVEYRTRWAGPAILVAAVGVILSLRRRPLIGIPVAIGAAFTQLTARQRLYALAAAACVVALIGWLGGDLIRAIVSDTLESYFDPAAQASTARGAMLAASVLIARRWLPLGLGFGQFGGFASQRFYSTVYDDYGLSSIYGLSPDAPYYITDTYWPHLLGEVGVLGALAMAAMLGVMWLRMRGVSRDVQLPAAIRLVGLFAALVLLEGIVESLGGPVFEFSLQALVIAVPVGIALRLARDVPRVSSSSAVSRSS